MFHTTYIFFTAKFILVENLLNGFKRVSQRGWLHQLWLMIPLTLELTIRKVGVVSTPTGKDVSV